MGRGVVQLDLAARQGAHVVGAAVSTRSDGSAAAAVINNLATGGKALGAAEIDRVGAGIDSAGLEAMAHGVHSAGIVAIVVRVILFKLRADRPDADGAAHTNEAASSADVDAGDALQRHSVDLDVAFCGDGSARIDLGLDVVVQCSNIDRARGADETARDADHERAHRRVVRRVDVDALLAVGQALMRAVDDRVGVDHGIGLPVDQRDANGARDADKASGRCRHDVQHVLRGLRLHDHPVLDAVAESVRAAGDDAAVQNAGDARAIAQRVHVCRGANRGLRVVAEHHHADRGADAHKSRAQRTGQLEDMAVVSGRNEDVTTAVDRG